MAKWVNPPELHNFETHTHTLIFTVKRVYINNQAANYICPDSKVHGANMGPTWVLSAPVGPHVGPMKLAIRVVAQDRVSQTAGMHELQHGPLKLWRSLCVNFPWLVCHCQFIAKPWLLSTISPARIAFKTVYCHIYRWFHDISKSRSVTPYGASRLHYIIKLVLWDIVVICTRL